MKKKILKGTLINWKTLVLKKIVQVSAKKVNIPNGQRTQVTGINMKKTI